MDFAERISHLRPEGAYVVLARARALEAEGREIIHLEIGQPDFDTYPHIALAGIRAIANGETAYNPSAGIMPLREALARDAGRRRGISLSPEQVVVAPGAKPILFLPMLALLEPGDEVIYPDPGFPTYEAAIQVSGAVPVPVPLDESAGFDLDLEALDAHLSPRTRMMIINSPGNPTGGILSRTSIEHVAQIAQERDCWVMSDEIYARLVYDGEVSSIAALPGMLERTIIVDGFSKTYAMTGWRLGFGIVPAALAEKLSYLLVHSVGCTATFTQYAGLAAVLGPQDRVEAVCQIFRRRRDRLIAGLNEIPGVHCHLPRGAFYAFPNVEAYGRPVEELAEYLLEEAGVALLPGTSFGANGKGNLRLSYANSIENIELALERMRTALAKL
ncbi:MAG: pyridoxal phosphate-dependent aminotransferase [Anaerolineae bacterium]